MVKIPFSRTRGKVDASYIRNFIFGVEDSLVSTVGLLSGIAIAEVEQRTILLAGVVLIFVEAFSMATGSYLSERGAEEYATQRTAKIKGPLIDGLIMFVSYFVTGFIPLLPYLLFSVSVAFPVSIIVTLVALFGLGALSGRFAKLNIFTNGLKALLVGGIAVLLGVGVGRLFAL